MAPTPKLIMFFDFDGTIIKGNSEHAVIPRVTLKYSYLSMGLAWFRGRYLELMQSMYRDQHKSGVTKEQMLAKLDGFELVPGMEDLFARLGDEFDAELVVISNSNTLFVDHILARHRMKKNVAKVIANPAEFGESGMLNLSAQGEYSCQRCPPNLCKGSVVEQYLAGSGREFDVVGFAGDGPNGKRLSPGLPRSLTHALFNIHRRVSHARVEGAGCGLSSEGLLGRPEDQRGRRDQGQAGAVDNGGRHCRFSKGENFIDGLLIGCRQNRNHFHKYERIQNLAGCGCVSVLNFQNFRFYSTPWV